MSRIAYFVSPHGFGHAARSAAIMFAMQRLDPDTHFDIVTQVPAWFFEDSCRGGFDYHEVCTDLGLVQHSALNADLDASLRRLDAFLPFDDAEITGLAERLGALGCEWIMCDIAPMGIAVAQKLGVPSMVVENFTWDWIYRAYVESHPDFSRHIDYLTYLFALADYHVQTVPVCDPRPCDLTVSPVYREPRVSSMQIRAQLNCAVDTPLVMLTMGGMPESYPFVKRLTERFPEIAFIIPSGAPELQRVGNVALLPSRSAFFHPDLVHACDVVLGKAGYSTVAEVYSAGVPYGYVLRESFRESGVLAAFIREHMHGLAVPEAAFQDGEWFDLIPELLRLPKRQCHEPNGADQVAQFVYRLVNKTVSSPRLP